MPITSTYQIANLSANTTFYDWFIKENDEIISKLNLMSVFSATGGDGILATTDSSGLVTIVIGGTAAKIDTGLTFNGDISFNGFVSIPNISYKITGITTGSSAGFSFGSPVRFVDSSDGYTLAKADNQERAESLGVISRITDTGTYVTVLGKIEGDFSGVNGGSALSPGCFYFLSPSVTGGISTTEPTNNGQVSKPVLLSLGSTAGLVLQYRGNYINSAAAGAGTTGGNRIFITIDSSLPGLTSQFTVGKVLSYNPALDETDTDTINYFTNNGNRNLFNGWFLSRATNNFEIPFGGREEDFSVGIITSITDLGSVYAYEIAIAGNVEYSLGSPGVYYLNADYDVDVAGSTQLIKSSSLSYNGKIFAIQYDVSNIVVVNNPRKGIFGQNNDFRLTSSAGSSVNTENLLLNGDFSIWQRSSFGKNSAYTTTGNLIFADMWRRHDGISGGDGTKSYSIQRQAFADIQSDVEGNPNYYLDVKALGLSGETGNNLLIGHVVKDAKSFNGQSLTLSFYAKCTYPDYVIQPYYARYNGTTQIDFNNLNGESTVSLTTSWQRFDIPFTIETLPSPGSPLENDYLEIGFDFYPLIEQANANSIPLGQNLVVSISSVCLFGNQAYTFPHIHKDLNERLDHCHHFYYSTYGLEENVLDKSMLNDIDANLTTKNHIILPINYCTYIQWPNEMRTTPSITVYSPKTGYTGDAYNQTATRDLRNCTGTLGYNAQRRVAKLGASTIDTNPTKNGVKLCVSGGAVPYDNIFYHIIADADYPI